MARRQQLGINFPPEVLEAWEVTRVGYPHTMFGMACLGAMLTIAKNERDALMTLVSRVDETGEGWERVEDWARRLIEARAERDARLDVLETADRARRLQEQTGKKTRSRAPSY